ncbi:MAG: hypothetical protein ACK5LV_10635 [Lachnospirales bacterium]
MGNEEIMKVLALLESKVINVEEAKELITTLKSVKKAPKIESEKIKQDASKFAKDSGEKFNAMKDKATPKVKNAFSSISDSLGKVSDKISDKISKKDAEGEDILDEIIEEDFIIVEDLDEKVEEAVEAVEEKVEEAVEEEVK